MKERDSNKTIVMKNEVDVHAYVQAFLQIYNKSYAAARVCVCVVCVGD